MKEAFFGVDSYGDDPATPGVHYNRTGISVQFNRDKQEMTVGGWYDGSVGIGYETVSLREFLDRVSITKADVDRAYALP